MSNKEKFYETIKNEILHLNFDISFVNLIFMMVNTETNKRPTIDEVILFLEKNIKKNNVGTLLIIN
jgi:hypothetical protein